MTAILVGLILVPVFDQMVKRLVLRRVGRGSISLGAIGQVRLVEARIWMVCARVGSDRRVMWTVWTLAASTLTILASQTPSLAWSSALLVGGSLSHAIEMSVWGHVCDYVCLRFWPPFNLADVSLTVGASGLVAELVTAVHHARL